MKPWCRLAQSTTHEQAQKMWLLSIYIATYTCIHTAIASWTHADARQHCRCAASESGKMPGLGFNFRKLATPLLTTHVHIAHCVHVHVCVIATNHFTLYLDVQPISGFSHLSCVSKSNLHSRVFQLPDCIAFFAGTYILATRFNCSSGMPLSSPTGVLITGK